MTGNEYRQIIDSFDVENSPKYQKRGHVTYCNVFAQDVASKCNAPLPDGLCSNMLDKLSGNKFPRWYSVTYAEAQRRANEGCPTIAITPDHIAMVRPNGDGSIPAFRREVRITQAGNTVLNDATLNYGWPPERLEEIRFYSWYG